MTLIPVNVRTRIYIRHERQNAEQGAERALFLRRTAENQRRNESFSQFGAENSQNGNFRRTQKGAEREASAKVERGDRLMPVSDMILSGFRYHVNTC